MSFAITVILDVLLLITGIVSSVTDFRSGKIYNRVLRTAALAGSILMAGYLFWNKEYIVGYFVNLLAAFVLGFVFFQEKIWGAGDAKFWIVIVMLFPYGQYYRTEYMLVPSIYILMVIFIFAYLFVVAESLLLLLGGKKGVIKTNGKIAWKEGILRWLFGFFVVSMLSKVLMLVLKKYYFQNQVFFSILFLIFIQWLGTRYIKRRNLYIIVLGCIYIVSECCMHDWNPRQYVINGLIVLIVILVGRVGAKYNYREIKTEEVKRGMILSQMTVALFQKSRVKNLPQVTDETTKSRISQEEADAVRRWKDSKYGKPSVVVISILPFAIFEMIGVIAYILLITDILQK